MKKVSIIGSGLIGQSWAMIFAGNGYKVSMYDINEQMLSSVISPIKEKLEFYESQNYLRGKGNSAAQLKNITTASSLKECLDGTEYVQECVYEDKDLKKKVFMQIDEIVGDDVILASSTSCILPSLFCKQMHHRSQVVVAHPVNPPYLVPVVEVVQTEWANPAIVSKTMQILKDVGQAPVLLKREIPGFAVNRVQYAILNECWRLVKDDVMSAADIDTVMKSGLGCRYAFLGPLETAHLNANGLEDYCDRYGKGIISVSQTFGKVPSWTSKDAASIAKEMIGLEELEDKRKERDEYLMELAKLKQKYNIV